MRYGINRNLKRKDHEYNIIQSSQFKKSQEKFQEACSLLKSKGHGFVEHYKEITPKGNLIHNIFTFNSLKSLFQAIFFFENFMKISI